MRQSPRLAYVALIVGLLALGASPLFVRAAHAPGVVTSFYRMLIGLVALTLPALRQARESPTLSRPAVGAALLAGFCFAADLALWSTGVVLGDALGPTLLSNTAPVWVGIATLVVFRRPLGRAFWLGLSVALVGAAVTLIMGQRERPELGLGSLLGLLSGIFYAGYFVATERARQALSSALAFGISALVSTLVLLATALLFDMPLSGFDRATLFNILAAGVIVQIVGYLAISYALGRLPATLVAVVLLGQPVLTALLVGPWLNEPVTTAQAVGGALVLAGVWIVQRAHT